MMRAPPAKHGFPFSLRWRYYHTTRSTKFSKNTWPMAETVSHISEHSGYQQFLDDFQQTIQDASLRLLEIPDEDAARRTTSEWSAKQVLGHLIDSAGNNHQRFIRAQFTDDLVFASYDGDQWVDAQKYNDAFWPDLVD